ncbi:uncharacterized protein BT62DRAFT_206857 [Guyanagaster necrorhizus]|uniref:Pericentrin/AKAP-450 centrosomal targeting domain-containing protein n=1 Tax=Guyanagaster necrorhizus TaxID=856835 RepID=A0A9P7VQW2_9AGAR|nr:uncharacterized protein BT62DRAFT_206857 [Guyanagaster necrorhizus MCA 3950]KAG7445045.1 hypothetical protein BT62DRAFT_206857 [Guyanagaster necrorhizus MCA 3950]
MAAMQLETPSRIWRRIEAVEDRDMPSLPSIPGFDDSDGSIEAHTPTDDLSVSDVHVGTPMHSTPALSSHHTSTSRNPSSVSSTARFAHSFARSAHSSAAISAPRGTKTNASYSFDVSAIPSLPDVRAESGIGYISDEGEKEEEEGEEEEGILRQSKDSVPDVYLPPDYADGDEEQDASISEALQSTSRSSSPFSEQVQPTPKKNYDYVVPLRSEPKPSPLDPYRNISMRRPLARTRTPSLSQTTLSPASSPPNSTPHSTKSVSINRSMAESPIRGTSVPLPPSHAGSPAAASMEYSGSRSQQDLSLRESDCQSSMDITESHISPIKDLQAEGQDQSFTSSNQVGMASDHGEHEPTFSSDGDDTSSPPQNSQKPPDHKSLAPMSSAFSSPAQSFAFTPTPAFSRPRARFNLPPPPSDLLATPKPEETDPSELGEAEPLTPHTRRKSFLLSIVNSTIRPRLKLPTPHPRTVIPPTPSIAETLTEPVDGPMPAVNLRTAFAGATPRPRINAGRPSHPLAQAYTATTGSEDSESSSISSIAAPKVATRRASMGVALQSPAYDGSADRASFISTASSHDLTTHVRANTSFDPAMGFGIGAQANGRFNAGKLNTYLHGLNRRLQEENEALIERLRRLEEGKKGGAETESPSEDGTIPSDRRLSGGSSRRISAGATVLGDVQEDVGGEGWIEEKVVLEEMIESFKEEIEKNMLEKEELEKVLDDEQQGRSRDKARWKERMVEVECGVEAIVKGLEQKLQDAETRAQTSQEALIRMNELERQLEMVSAERDLATERAEKSEKVLESGKELGGELKEANDRINELRSDLRISNIQIKELEQEVLRSDERIDVLEKDSREEKNAVQEIEKELSNKMGELDAQKRTIQNLRGELKALTTELQTTKLYVSELESDADAAADRLEALELEVTSANDQVKGLQAEAEETTQRLESLEVEAQQDKELARQMEEALDAAEHKMAADDQELSQLKSRLLMLQRERERSMETSSRSVDPSREIISPVNTADIEALEEELDNAHREIARLNTVLSASPARKAIEKAKDVKIDMLEKENEALSERIKALKIASTSFNTPGRIISNSGISPIHRRVLSMSFKTPRTPGTPLKEMSWLNSQTGDADHIVSPLIAEISRLQYELDIANESIDDKLDKLEDAGLGVVGLTQKLEDARARIVALEDEISRLIRKEERRMRRLEKARCRKCMTKVNFNFGLSEDNDSSLEISHPSLASEPPTPPTKTSEVLRANLKSLNSQLSSMKKQWYQEREQLQGEKEEATKISQTEKAGQKIRSDVQADLDKAKRTISELEAELKSERAQLRMLAVEQARVGHERDNIILQLQRTETDMEDVRQHLQKYKKENHDMETELRQNANAEQKARLLENRVTENTETIEQLRQERALLVADHKALQTRFSEISEHANRLRDEHAASQISHDNRIQQLDLHMTEIDDLRRALSNQGEELQRVETEKNRISAERSEVSRTVAVLEADLKRVKQDAEAFGRDLKLLRSEKDRAEAKQKDELARAERAKKQAQTQVRLLTEQLDAQKAKVARAKEQMEQHACTIDEQQLSAIKLQHNKECKGLIVQIRYLKAKYIRESNMRLDLVYQKQYLMILLGKMENSEKTIFAAISRIGFPVEPPSPPAKHRKFKTIAQMLVFLSRVRRASAEWQKQCESKEAIAAALQDMRRRRDSKPS